MVIQEKLSRINQSTTSKCRVAEYSGDMIEDIEHALIKCPGNNDLGRVCLNIENALLLNFETEKSIEFPIVCFFAVT